MAMRVFDIEHEFRRAANRIVNGYRSYVEVRRQTKIGAKWNRPCSFEFYRGKGKATSVRRGAKRVAW
jgi:hypothetical protein